MNIRWKLLLIKGIIWLASEIILTIVGLDDLADYSELLSEKNMLYFSTTLATT